jgi:hypothetical protein
MIWKRGGSHRRALGSLGICAPVVLALLLAACGDEPDPASGEPAAGSEDRPEHVKVHEDTVPGCEACELQLVPLGTFGRLDDSILLRGLPRVERDSRGRFYAWVRGARDHELIVYRPNGEVQGTVGGFGSGPGEFLAIENAVIGRGDTLFVTHEDRVTLFDSAGSVVASMRLDPGADADRNPVGSRSLVAVSEDGFVFAERRRGEAYEPLHQYDRSGMYRRQFGPPNLAAELYLSWPPDRRPSVGEARAVGTDSGTLWVVRPEGGYHLAEAALDGSEGSVIGVRAPDSWNFVELSTYPAQFIARVGEILAAPRPATGPGTEGSGLPPPEEFRMPMTPPGGVRGLAELEPDLLAVALRVPSPNWEEASATRADARPTQALAHLPALQAQIYDTVLDILDVERGVVLARERIPGPGYLTSDGTLYTVHVDAVGVVSFQAFRIEFARR